MSGSIQPGKRYHVVNWGADHAALVEGVPDPDNPHDPSKDRKDGDAIFVGENYAGSQFWADLLEADVVWVSTGFKRYYEYAPQRAARIREGVH